MRALDIFRSRDGTPERSAVRYDPVTQDWVGFCSIKMQTVLMSSLRGCDGVSKEDPSKGVVRGIRSEVIRSAEPGTPLFMDGSKLLEAVNTVTGDLDHYPLHWVAHTMHAAEIIAFKKPGEEQVYEPGWLSIYYKFVEALHLLPETEAHLDLRLADREFTDTLRNEYRRISPHTIIEVESQAPPPRARRRSGYGG